MFTKPRCKKCDEKVSKKYAFCPHCGFSQKEGSPDQFFEPIFKLGFPFNKLFKEIERQFQEIDANLGDGMTEENIFSHGISINIDTKNGQPTIRINNANPNRKTKTEEKTVRANENVFIQKMDESQAQNFSKLPKEEPPTKVRRFNNKLVYEINLPEVANENLSVTKLENSIEVKAFSKDKAFFKLIPLALPIMKSELKEGILNLELKL